MMENQTKNSMEQLGVFRVLYRFGVYRSYKGICRDNRKENGSHYL